jgi:hypothetical protein
MTPPLTDNQLSTLEALLAATDPAPWKAMVEGRDHDSGDSFIQIGAGPERRGDMYVSRDGIPAGAEDLDAIAAARNAVPDLVAEVRRLRSSHDS